MTPPATSTARPPAPPPARRIILHAHSTFSHDGDLTLARIHRIATACGIALLGMSEHDYDLTEASHAAYTAECHRLSATGCVLLPGVEYSSADDDLHILVWGHAGFLGPRPDPDLLRATAAAPHTLSAFAHPIRRNALAKIDAATLAAVDAVEILNRKVDGLSARPEVLSLARRHGKRAIAGLDLHALRQLAPVSNRVHLSAASLAAARAGDPAGVIAELHTHGIRPRSLGLDPTAPAAQPLLRAATGLARGAGRLRRVFFRQASKAGE